MTTLGNPFNTMIRFRPYSQCSHQKAFDMLRRFRCVHFCLKRNLEGKNVHQYKLTLHTKQGTTKVQNTRKKRHLPDRNKKEIEQKRPHTVVRSLRVAAEVYTYRGTVDQRASVLIKGKIEKRKIEKTNITPDKDIATSALRVCLQQHTDS